jgi:hypothetical protein
MDNAARAQRWHDTDHGQNRGTPLRRNKFRKPSPDPERNVPANFRECRLCDPVTSNRNNPFWNEATGSS